MPRKEVKRLSNNNSMNGTFFLSIIGLEHKESGKYDSIYILCWMLVRARAHWPIGTFRRMPEGPAV